VKKVLSFFICFVILCTIIGIIGKNLSNESSVESSDGNTYTVHWESANKQEVIPSVSAYSDAYTNSEYYTALCNVQLTGDYRNDIINIALSQVGYKEGNSEKELAGNVSGSGDYTEYGRSLESAGSAWCSEFASWCIRNAGVPTSVIANSRAANVTGYIAYTSAEFYTWDATIFGGGNYLPQKGDLLLWSWDGKMYGTEENLSHTSILWKTTKLENGNVLLTTIDGNSNNQVQVREYEVSAAEGRLIGKNGLVCYIIAPRYED